MPSTFDYTRVRIGDSVRDDQTLQEGQIVDLQSVGQWGILVTIIDNVSGLMNDHYFLRSEAPAGTTISDFITSGIRTTLLPGEVISLQTGSAATSEKFTVTRIAAGSESAAVTMAKAKGDIIGDSGAPFARLRNYITDAYGTSQTIQGANKDEILKALDVLEASCKKNGTSEKFALRIRQIISEPWSSGSPIGAIKSEMLAHSPGSAAASIRKELQTAAPSTVSINPDIVSKLAQIIDSAERYKSVISGTSNATIASDMSRRVIGGGTLTTVKEMTARIDKARIPSKFTTLANTMEGMSPPKANKVLDYFLENSSKYYSADDFETDVLGQLRNTISETRESRSAARKFGHSISNMDKTWGAVRGTKERTLSSITQALETARFYDQVSFDEAKKILADLNSAYDAGKAGGPLFKKSRKALIAIGIKMNDNGFYAATERRLETLQGIQTAIHKLSLDPTSALSRNAQFALDTGTMADNKRDFVDAQSHRRGLMYAEDLISKEKSNYGSSVYRSQFGRETAKKQAEILGAAKDARNQLNFGNVIMRETRQGMRVRITSVDIGETIKVMGTTADTRVLNPNNFFLLTNITDPGADPMTALTSAIASRIKTQVSMTGSSPELGRLVKLVKAAAQQPADFFVGGKRYSGSGQFMDDYYGPNGAVTFESKIRQSVKSKKQNALIRDTDGETGKIGEFIFDDTDDAIGAANAAYDQVIRRGGSSLKDVHEKAMEQALQAAQRPTPKERGISTVNLDDALTQLDTLLNVERHGEVVDPYKVMAGVSSSLEDKRRTVMIETFGVDERVANALIMSDPDRTRDMVRSTIKQMHTDTPFNEAMLDGHKFSHLQAKNRSKAKKLVELLNSDTDETIMQYVSVGKRPQVRSLMKSAAYTNQQFAHIEENRMNTVVHEGLLRLFPSPDSLSADFDGKITIKLHEKMLKAHMGQGTDNSAEMAVIDLIGDLGLGHESEYSYHGKMFPGKSLVYREGGHDAGHRLAVAGNNLLVDSLAKAYGIEAPVAYELYADILLKKNMGGLLDTAQIPSEAYLEHTGLASKLYELPGHGGSRMNYLSTSEGAQSFRRQINAMRDMVSGKIDHAYVLDIEMTPGRITEVGWLNTKRNASGIFKETGFHSMSTAGGETEESMISGVLRLIDSNPNGSPLVIATHNKAFDFPQLADRAEALGMSEASARLRAVHAGNHPDIVNIDTMVAARMADPAMASTSVQNAAVALRLRPADWVEAHAAISDDRAQLDIMNEGLTRGRANIMGIRDDSPANMGGQLVWGTGGDSNQRGRLFKVVGYTETPEMLKNGQSAVMLQQLQFDKTGSLVEGKLHPVATAGHKVGQMFSGNFAAVGSMEEGAAYLSNKIDDLSGRRVRDIIDKVDRPYDEMARIEAIRKMEVSRPEINDSLRTQLENIARHNMPIEDLSEESRAVLGQYGEADKVAKWLYEWGHDTRTQAQLTGNVNDFIEKEFKPVHKDFYDFVRGLGLDDRKESQLLGRWHSGVDTILGGFSTVEGHTRPQFERELTVDLPGTGNVAINISSPERMQAGIDRAATRIAKHLDTDRIEKTLTGIASESELQEFLTNGQKMSLLSHESRDALTQSIWDQEIFQSFKSSRTPHTSKIADAALSRSLATPDALKAAMLKIGADPNEVSAEFAALLDVRQYTKYTPREASPEQLVKVGALTEHYRNNWEQYVSDAPEHAAARNFLPYEGFIYKNLQGKTIDEVQKHYEDRALSHVGTWYEDAKEARKAGVRQARDFFADVYTDEDIYNRLGEPVKKDLLTRFGHASYNDPAAQQFKTFWETRGSDATRGEISQSIASATSSQDLVDVAHPTSMEGTLGELSPHQMTGLSRNPNLTPDARGNLRYMAAVESAETASGLLSEGASSAFSASVLQTKHTAARQSIVAASEFLSGNSMSPQIRLTVASIGVAAALFVGRKPNVEANEESMTPKRRFEQAISKTEIPIYHRIVAQVTGQTSEDQHPTEDDLVAGARAAMLAHIQAKAGNTLHSSSDTRKDFSKQDTENIGSRLLLPGRPIQG